MRFSILMFLFVVLVSCKKDIKKDVIENRTNVSVENKEDTNFVLSQQYKIGDVRRYGIYPDSTYTLIHPFTKKSKLETVLDLAESQNIELNFPKGFYNFRLLLIGRKNITINFEDALFGGIIQIYEKDSIISENIKLTGKLTSYEGFFTRKSKNISIDNLYLLTNQAKSFSKLRNKGCKLYGGTNGFKLSNLVIEDLGSGSESYKYNGAALAIEGWNNNPKDVEINKVVIKSSDKHAVYMTGKDNVIKDLIVEKFGVGSKDFLIPLEDSVKGEEKEFTALWMNKCDYCFVDKVTINEKGSKGANTVFLDTGNPIKTSEIGELIILNDNPNIGIKKEANTNVEIISTVIK